MFAFLSRLSRDGVLVFVTRVVRMFAFGSLGMILALYFHDLGLSDRQIGGLLTCTMLSDAVFSLLVVIFADKLGRSRMLALGAWLMAMSGILLGIARGSSQLVLLLIATTLGVVPPTEYEFGPFSVLEQSILAGLIPPQERTQVFAWYEMYGFLASALGSLVAGELIERLQSGLHLSRVDSYRAVMFVYGALGVFLAMCFHALSPAVEVARSEAATDAQRALLPSASSTEKGESADAELPSARNKELSFFTLQGESLWRAAKLSALFTLDAFAGAFITGSMLAYWFHFRFGVGAEVLGEIFSVSMFLAGTSFLLAPILAKRFGLVNTMVFTHLPGNILTILVPLMPSLQSAIAMIFLRFSIAQMHVPARQSYVASIARPEERTVTLGVTDLVRHVGASVSPSIAGWLKEKGQFGLIFFCCGFFKILYDILLLWSFWKIKPPEEQQDCSLQQEMEEE